MDKLSENFSKNGILLFKILLGTYLINIVVLSMIILSEGDIPFWLIFLVLPVGIYYIVMFFVYLYRVSIFYNREHGKEVVIWRSGLGIFLAVVGLAFSFLNYVIIAIANVY